MTFALAIYAPRFDLRDPIASVFNHIVGTGITVLERHWGSHIAPVVVEDASDDGVLDCVGGDTWDAELGGLKRRCFADAIRGYTGDGSRIWVYRFASPLTGEQKARGLAYCRSVEGLPYDCLDFARRAVLDVAEWMSYVAPVVPAVGTITSLLKGIASVDISKALGIQAAICYRVGANFLSSLGFEGIDGATFGPHAIKQLQAAGVFREAVEATNDGGPYG